MLGFKYTFRNIYMIASCIGIGLQLLNISCSTNENTATKISLKASMDTTRFSPSKGSVSLLINSSGNWSVKEADGRNWLSFSETEGKDSARIRVFFDKNTSNDERFAQVIVYSGSESRHLYVSQRPAPDGGYSSQGDYFEIPKDTSILNTIRITRFLPGPRAKMRNYTMLYDTDMKIAYWIAYPLHEDYLGKIKRTDFWNFDPFIATNQQPSLFSGFYGYDRGHQIPSADRTHSDEENYTTFYFTNMTPQNSSLNQGVWVNLESQVRTWAKVCDTMYVVTGAMIRTRTDTKVFYISDNIGAKVALPKYYFKALAQKRGKNYYTVAYRMGNEKPASGASPALFQISVRQLEEETGFTFFPSLSRTDKEKIDAEVWK